MSASHLEGAAAQAGARPQRSATIVAVCPSPWTDIERTFWHNFAESVTERGWRFIEVTPFDEPTNPRKPGAERIVVPVLWVFGREEAARWAHLDGRDPEWLSPSDIVDIAEFEHRRDRVNRLRPTDVPGVRRLARLAESMMTEIRPAIVMTTNKIEPHCAIFRKAALHHGAQVGLIERSPLDSIWYEPDGLFTESKLWTLPAESLTTEPQAHARMRIIGNPAGFRPDEMSPQRPTLSQLPRPIVFCPFDNIWWTGWAQRNRPQGIIDNPAFPTPQDAIDGVSHWVATKGGSLVVKAHPGCKDTSHLGFPPNTYFVDGALDHLIQSADMTVAFNTKVAFVALAAGCPTVTLSQNPAAASGLTTHWQSFESIEDALDAGLESSAPDPERVDAFLTWLDKHYFWFSEREGPRSPQDLADALITNAGPVLSGSSRAAIARFQAYADGDARAIHPSLRVPASKSDAGRVFLDVTRLVQPDVTNTGIARYGREILRRMADDSSLDVWAVVRDSGPGFTVAALPLHEELDRMCHGRVLYLRPGQRFRDVALSLGPLHERDIFHSIHLPLPPRQHTAPVQRLITVHDVLHLKRSEFNPHSGVPVVQRVVDSIDPNRDFVVCDSEQTKRDLLSLSAVAGHNVTTIALGAAIPAPRLGVTNKSTVVVFLQSEPRKNAQETVAAACAVLRQPQHQHLRLAAVLSRNFPLKESWFRDAGFPLDRVDSLASPTDDDMADLYHRASAFLFGSHYEGFGLPVLEAMAHGVPTVVPMNSSLIEVAGDAACYAVSSNASDLADALDRVLSDQDYASELSEAGKNRSATLTWQHSVAHLAALYRAIRAGEPLGVLAADGDDVPRSTPEIAEGPPLAVTGLDHLSGRFDGQQLFITLDPERLTPSELRQLDGRTVLTSSDIVGSDHWHSPPRFVLSADAAGALAATEASPWVDAFYKLDASEPTDLDDRCHGFEVSAAHPPSAADHADAHDEMAVAIGASLGFDPIVLVGHTEMCPSTIADYRATGLEIVHANSPNALVAPPVDLTRALKRFRFGSKRPRIGIDFVNQLSRAPTGLLHSLMATLQGTSLFEHDAEFVAICASDNPLIDTELAALRTIPQLQFMLTSDAGYRSAARDLDAILLPWNDATTRIPVREDAKRIVYINDLIPLNHAGYPPELGERYRSSGLRADAVLCLSESARDAVASQLELDPAKCFVAAVALEPDLVSYTPADDIASLRSELGLSDRYVMYPAALRPHKNHAVLIEALDRIDPTVQLLLTTAESHATEAGARLRSELKELGLESRVVIAGRLERDAYLALLAHASVLVCPSKDEGFGIPVAEAQRLGVPVVSTRCGALAEVAVGSLEIDPDDPDALAAEVNALLADSSLRQAVIAAGYANTKRYTNEWGAHGLLSAIEHVCAPLSVVGDG